MCPNWKMYPHMEVNFSKISKFWATLIITWDAHYNMLKYYFMYFSILDFSYAYLIMLVCTNIASCLFYLTERLQKKHFVKRTRHSPQDRQAENFRKLHVFCIEQTFS